MIAPGLGFVCTLASDGQYIVIRYYYGKSLLGSSIHYIGHFEIFNDMGIIPWGTYWS